MSYLCALFPTVPWHVDLSLTLLTHEQLKDSFWPREETTHVRLSSVSTSTPIADAEAMDRNRPMISQPCKPSLPSSRRSGKHDASRNSYGRQRLPIRGSQYAGCRSTSGACAWTPDVVYVAGMVEMREQSARAMYNTAQLHPCTICNLASILE